MQLYLCFHEQSLTAFTPAGPVHTYDDSLTSSLFKK